MGTHVDDFYGRGNEDGTLVYDNSFMFQTVLWRVRRFCREHPGVIPTHVMVSSDVARQLMEDAIQWVAEVHIKGLEVSGLPVYEHPTYPPGEIEIMTGILPLTQG